MKSPRPQGAFLQGLFMNDAELVNWLFEQIDPKMEPPSDYKWRVIRLFQILFEDKLYKQTGGCNGGNTKAQLD